MSATCDLVGEGGEADGAVVDYTIARIEEIAEVLNCH
jgi:hypothetical protein